MREVDIEEINKKTHEVLSREFDEPSEHDVIKYRPLIETILNTPNVITKSKLFQLKRSHGCNVKNSFLLAVYLELKRQKQIDTTNEHILRKTLQIKPGKSWSGIVTVTIFTAAYPEYTNSKGERIKQPFSCKFDCSFCPKENRNPRSYLSLEPGVLRAIKNDYDCAKQIWSRLHALYMCGHVVDKIEIIVSGGTWTSYPIEYREEFCRDVYYAANTFQSDRRPRLSLTEEKTINQTTEHRIVGFTIETRPDTINPAEIRRLRYYGVTRVQLGIQHIEDDILDRNNRQCKTERTIKGIKLLKENCYKIDAHWMLNLPGSSAEKDDHMLNKVLFNINKPIRYETKYNNRTWYEYLRGTATIKEYWEYYDITCPELSHDTAKIYPCAVLPYTEIEKWYKSGEYIPYDGDTMFNILVKTMESMLPWVRVARIIRDIPREYMYNENTGADNTSMRQDLNDYMLQNNIYSMDIRNREVKDKDWDGNYYIVIRKYKASEGDEYFISAESQNKKTIYGFVRLRLDNPIDKVFEELNGAGLIREVHVYGDLTTVGIPGKHVQHRGIGRTLMKRAEDLAKEYKYTKTAVIAAEGNKEYYKKLGYQDSCNFMVKYL